MHETHNDFYACSVLSGPICAMLGIDWSEVIECSGIGGTATQDRGLLVSAEEYIALWNTMIELTEVQSIPALLGQRIAAGPAIPVLFALSTAPNFEVGLNRLSRHKHLFGPMRFATLRSSGTCTIRVLADAPHVALPDTFSSPQIIYLHAKAKMLATRPLAPLSVTLPLPLEEREALGDLFSMVLGEGPPSISYRAAAMRSPFISPNERLWTETDKDLQSLSLILSRNVTLTHRVRAVLIEAFATTEPSIAYACSRLKMSKSTLLRRLRDEGTTFEALRAKTRLQLAKRYLGNSDLNNQQIAHLVGYRDTSAFQRAFRKWTGMTPQMQRAILSSADP